ncbi:MAG TPA: AraC family transcriptional regulator [Devosia sp.]|nr:AraC family transcriptional regulator [Devosia sp.]
MSRIESFSSLRSEVAEALACIGSGRANIKMKARELGVSVRTLQRLVRGATRMPPLFWSRLARVRKSARAAVHPVCLAQTACKFGFADQAHMSREFRHWLNISPSGLRSDRHVPGQLEHKGYC